MVGQHPAHLGRLQVVEIVGEEQPGLLLVADKAIDLLQKIPPLHGNAHVGHHGIDLFAVLFGVAQHLLHGVLFQVDLQRDGVAVGKDLVALVQEQLGQGRGVRPLGDGGGHIAVVVKDGQPGAHAVRHPLDVLGVHLVVGQLVDDVLPKAGFIHQPHKGGPQLHVGNVLRHVPAHAAVHLLHPPGIPPAGDVGGERIALDVHKNCTEYNDSHNLNVPF